MSLKAFLTVDLNDSIKPEQRKLFFDRLRELKWVKTYDHTSTWTAEFKDGTTTKDVLQITKADLMKASNESFIFKYHAAVRLGNNSPQVIKAE